MEAGIGYLGFAGAGTFALGRSWQGLLHTFSCRVSFSGPSKYPASSGGPEECYRPLAGFSSRGCVALAAQVCKPIAMFRAAGVVFLSLFVLCLLARSVGRHLTGYVGPIRRVRTNRALGRRRER